ncbi:MAG: M56 family metallopeptidase, partial [Planctomycetota bacterium]
MHGNLAPGYELWLEPVLVLAVGAVVIAGLAALAGRLTAAAVWQRIIWQAATIGLLALLALELTGTGSALVRLVRQTTESVPVETEPADKGRPENNSGTVPIFPQGKWDCPPPKPGAQAVPAEEEQDSIQAVEATADDRARLVRGEELPAVAAAGITTDWTAPAGASLAWSEAAHFGADVATEQSLGATVPAAAEIEVEGPPPRATVEVSGRASPSPITAVSRGEESAVAAVREPRSDYGWWLGTVWGFGAALLAVRLLWARFVLLLFRRRHAVVSNEALRRRVGALARRLGVRRPVTVLEAAGLSAPVAFGSLRPTLALPRTFADEFDRRQQEAMIAHELAHLAARDPAWQLVADATCAALWWHPACWWSRRRLRAASEAAADEASLVIPEGPDVLASCLVALGRRLATGAHARRLGWVSIEGPGFRSGLGRRVERLLRLSSRRRPPRRGFLAFGAATLPVTLVIVAVLSTAWAHPQATSPKGETTMNVLASSWRRSLAAAAVAVFLAPISGDALSEEHGEREVLAQRLEALRTALPALREAERGDAVELVERAIHAGEVTLEGRKDDEAHQIRE